jgi:hypothetical protein
MIELLHGYVGAASKVALLALACHEARAFYRFMCGPRAEDSEDHYDTYEYLNALLIQAGLYQHYQHDPLKTRHASVHYTAVLNSMGGLMYTRKLTQRPIALATLVIHKAVVNLAK